MHLVQRISPEEWTFFSIAALASLGALAGCHSPTPVRSALHERCGPLRAVPDTGEYPPRGVEVRTLCEALAYMQPACARLSKQTVGSPTQVWVTSGEGGTMLSIGNGYFDHTDYFDSEGRRVGESSFADDDPKVVSLDPGNNEQPDLNRRSGSTTPIQGVRCLYCGEGPNSARCQNVTQ